MTPSELPLLWIDGEIHGPSAAGVSALDHGLLLGDGVFDTIAVRGGQPVFLERHLRRLRRGIDRLAIDRTPSDTELVSGVEELVNEAGLAEARIRITVTPGPGPGPSPRDRGEHPLTVISIDALHRVPTSVSLCTVGWIRNERSPLAGIKSTSWGDNASILRFARAGGHDNAILCDSVGRLSECTTSNLFLVVDQVVLTPSLGSGCLPGIIREVLLESGIATEADLRPEDLDRATEVFVTSSTTGVVPVRRIDARDFTIVGPLTGRAGRAVEEASAR